MLFINRLEKKGICRKYKGIEPCVEKYCDCWHLDVVRKLAKKGGNKNATKTNTYRNS